MEFLRKIFDNFPMLTVAKSSIPLLIFAKISVLDVRLGSEYETYDACDGMRTTPHMPKTSEACYLTHILQYVNIF